LSFVGIELDTVSSEARLPQNKIHKCVSLISQFLQRKKSTLREIQSLTGLLNFACSVVQQRRAFLRRLIDLTIGVSSPCHYIHLNHEAKQDITLWLAFLEDFNGKTFFVDDNWLSSEKLNLYTDASGAIGIWCSLVLWGVAG
jgi:hypothetical protein